MNLKKLFCLTALCLFSILSAEEGNKELLLAYFPSPFVEETLQRFDVPKDKWEVINQELSSKDDEVIRLVDEKASKMDPNPLLDGGQKQVAAKLFRETLYHVFSEVMFAHGVSDAQKVQEMLDCIQQLKAERFYQCMQNRKVQISPIPDEELPG